MSTDRELLELAAKSAGLMILRCPHGLLRNCTGTHPASNIFSTPKWNPLADDGDALRLAVKLNLTIKVMGDHVKVGWRECGEQWPGEEAPTPSELPAATRRAIVRAAAEIGRTMV